MKRRILFILIVIAGLANAQEIFISGFNESTDSSYWTFYNFGDISDTNNSYINYSLTSNASEGDSALQVDYNIQNSQAWGGVMHLLHWNPDSSSTYDWSLFDTLSIMYNNIVPASESGRVHFRLNLHDVSNSPDTTNTRNTADAEYYYSFHYILDDQPGWHKLKIPLVNNYDWNGNGFNLTGWAGIAGNNTLDLDRINGFSYEFSINGGGEGDYVNGSIIFDHMALIGPAENSLIIFNGMNLNSNVTPFTWGQSTLEIIERGGENNKTNALLWTQGDEFANGWSGVGCNLDPPKDIAYRWDLDSLKFKAKIDGGTGTIRVQLESGASEGIMGYLFDPIADDQWHEYSFALKDFIVMDGKPNFDPSNITVFHLIAEASAVAGQKILFDYIWTGNPEIDVLPPEEPGSFVAVQGDYTNLLVWNDVPGESGETYDVYYSSYPITDLNSPGIEVVQLGIEEGVQIANHELRAPLTDQTVTYYYAIVCNDAAGNSSGISLSDPQSISNTAKGVPVINWGVPENFEVNNDFSEWNNISPFRMYPSDGSGTVVQNTQIDGDDDLSAKAYLAMDNNYIYFAFDVEDDIFSFDNSLSRWLSDGVDLYIGLYNWHGPSHTNYQRGNEPDYQIRFIKSGIFIENTTGEAIKEPGNDYAFTEMFPTGYRIEGKISFQEISTIIPEDILYTPDLGHRIKIDFSINDADATGQREGILTYSPKNEDRSYFEVNRWLYTWVGNSNDYQNYDWISNITVSDAGGLRASKVLTIGQHPYATDGLDAELGELLQPPPPPTDVFDARLLIPNTSEYSLKDFRNTSLEEIEWNLSYQPGTDGYPITLNWDNNTLPDGSFYLQDMLGGIVYNVNMKETNSFTVTNPAIASLKILFKREICFDISVNQDWNMLSIPLEANDMHVNTLFADAVSPLYSFNNGYILDTSFTVSKGYWLRFDNPNNYSVCGQVVQRNANLSIGWNMIGVMENDIPVDQITTVPENIINSPVYGFANGYVIPDTLKVGKGYWIKASQQGELIYNSTRSGLLPKANYADLYNSASISVSEVSGKIKNLYIADNKYTMTELPPKPPKEVFDVRYVDNTFASALTEWTEIEIQSESYPLTITANGLDITVMDNYGGEFINTVLSDGSSITIEKENISSIRVKRIEIPADYSLYQNYPNPFNPETIIKFGLPEKTKVRLAVYNVLGQQVAVLVNEVMQPGYHEVKFSGNSTANGVNLASGVYIYRLASDNFTSIKKMLLVK